MLWAQLGNELAQHMVTHSTVFGPSTFSSSRLHRASCTLHSEPQPGNQLLLRRYQPNVKKKTAEAKRCKLGRAQSRTSHPLLLGPSHPQHFQHHYHPPQIITWETRARLVILWFNLRPRSHDFPPQPTDQPPPPTGGKKKKLYTDIYM